MVGKCQDARADTIATGLHGPTLRDSVDTAYQALLYVGAEFGFTVEHLRAKRFGVHLVNISEPKEAERRPGHHLGHALGRDRTARAAPCGGRRGSSRCTET